MQIDPELSRRAIDEHVATPLGLGAGEAASSIYKIVNQNMVLGIEEISVRKGFDPRKFLMVVGGGASAVHVADLARTLQIPRILIPAAASQLCALGTLLADVNHEYVKALFTLTNELRLDEVNALYNEMEAKALEQLRNEGFSPEKIRMERSVDARYAGQIWELTVPVPAGELTDEAASAIAANFHTAHEGTYNYSQREMPVECLHWRLTAIGEVPELKFPEKPASSNQGSTAHKGDRQVYFGHHGFITTPVYDGDKLLADVVIEGPAIIEEPATTIVVPEASRVTVNTYGDYLMEIEVTRA